ncbi:MBL fold metallo-hydrolase [Candidatus Kaiserbacteria bacterium]|nr:MAG: MBL fold metallo-hydrolase [Candidatus Kaiserbacteria bacterium]
MRELRLPTIGALISIFILSLFSLGIRPSGNSENETLKVSFLDVGQGDATLIESPSGTQVLIDGGADSRVLSVLSRELGFFDRSIDMLVATHPDQDHIGGLVDVLIRYDVDTVLMTENENDTPVSDAFQKMVEEEGARVIYVRNRQVYDLGIGKAGSTTLTILFPDHDPTNMESNDSSIISRLEYGATSYLFTGDSPQKIEEYLVERDGSLLHSDVLKVGHHGSRTSTSEIFLTTVAPTYALISAGKDNKYGHPHKEVTDLLIQHGITYKNTADLGSINSETDGVTFWFK